MVAQWRPHLGLPDDVQEYVSTNGCAKKGYIYIELYIYIYIIYIDVYKH